MHQAKATNKLNLSGRSPAVASVDTRQFGVSNAKTISTGTHEHDRHELAKLLAHTFALVIDRLVIIVFLVKKLVPKKR